MKKIEVKDGFALIPIYSIKQPNVNNLQCITKLPNGIYENNEVVIEISSNDIDAEFAPYGSYVLIKK